MLKAVQFESFKSIVPMMYSNTFKEHVFEAVNRGINHLAKTGSPEQQDRIKKNEPYILDFYFQDDPMAMLRVFLYIRDGGIV
jgi:hypothetical protein